MLNIIGSDFEVDLSPRKFGQFSIWAENRHIPHIGMSYTVGSALWKWISVKEKLGDDFQFGPHIIGLLIA